MSLNNFKGADPRIGSEGQAKGSGRNRTTKPPYAASGQPRGGNLSKKPCYGAQGQAGAKNSRSGVATRPVVAD